MAGVTSSLRSPALQEILPPETPLKRLSAHRRSVALDFTNSVGLKCQAVVRPLQKVCLM